MRHQQVIYLPREEKYCWPHTDVAALAPSKLSSFPGFGSFPFFLGACYRRGLDLVSMPRQHSLDALLLWWWTAVVCVEEEEMEKEIK